MSQQVTLTSVVILVLLQTISAAENILLRIDVDSNPGEITTNIAPCRNYEGKSQVTQYLSSMLSNRRLRQSVLNSKNDDIPVSRQRRSITLRPKRQTYHVEIFVVADNALYMHHDNNLESVTARVHTIVNMVDTLYRPLNVRITIVGIEIWSSEDKVLMSTNNVVNIQRFSEYVKNRAPYDMADHVHLLTGQPPFLNSSIGIAMVGTTCSRSHATALTMDFQTATYTAHTMAHEIGHSLGMPHDDAACSCSDPNSFCVMEPKSRNLLPKAFSSCSNKYLTDFLDNYYKPACLLNVPTVTNAVRTTCGNNVLDPGEECDCGDADFCNNPCCNPNTCKLTKGSECYEGGCCNNCKIQSKGTCCRNVLYDSACDLPDVCDGTSNVCKDKYRQDRTSCGVEGKCYQGKCQSHLLQCNYIWGDGVKNGDDQCYQLNKKGSWYGHCGATGDFTACAAADVKCGKLYCGDISQQFPIVGWKRGVDVLTVTFNGHSHSCAVPRIDWGRSQSNETMVEDGTPCGTNRICQNQKCVALQTFQTKCAADCIPPYGFCTNEGTCLCGVGWTGDDCSIQMSIRSPDYIGCLPPPSDDSSDSQIIHPTMILWLPMFCLVLIISTLS